MFNQVCISFPLLLLSSEILGCLITPSSDPQTENYLPNTNAYFSQSNNAQSPNFASEQSDSETQLFNDFWRWSLMISPEMATTVGHHENDDKMDEHTLEEYEEHKIGYQTFLDRARKLQQNVKSSEDKIHLLVLIWELELLLMSESFNEFPFFLTNMKGSHTRFGGIIFSQKLKTEDDFWKYIKRLKALARQVYQDIELLKIGIRTGRTLHNLSVHEVPKQLSLLLQKPEKSLYYYPFRIIARIRSIPRHVANHIKAEGIQVVVQVQNAYRDLQDFLIQDYARFLRPQIGLNSIEGGREYYKYCLKKYTSTNLSPEEIHEMGKKEVERIDEVMQNIIREHGSNESMRQFSEKLRHDPRFVFKSPEEKLAVARHNIYEVINPTLPKLFWKMPQLGLQIQSTPDIQSNGPGASYIPGSLKENRTGTVFINTKFYKEFPKYDLLTDCMHEGNPGHHLQTTFSLTKTKLPKFRQVGFSEFYGAFLEGWALYAEYLGLELGIFSNLYDRYGHFSWENFRAARLVVDTGIHYYGWTKQEAMDYFLIHTASSVQEIEREVDRYVTMPGQACGYKVGELKIRELRRKAETQLEYRFDIRDFHEALLNCGKTPLQVLELCLDDYIMKTQNQPL